MIDEEAFGQLVDEITSQGYDEATAAYWASIISDRPVYDQQGNIVVEDGGQVLARLKPLKFFGG